MLAAIKAEPPASPAVLASLAALTASALAGLGRDASRDWALRRTEENEMLRIYDFALELLRDLKPIVGKIAASDPDLARQLRRAATSMLLNIAEGAGGRAGTRRQRYYDALGSTRESAACLDAAGALGYCAIDAKLRDRFERVAATLVNVVK